MKTSKVNVTFLITLLVFILYYYTINDFPRSKIPNENITSENTPTTATEKEEKREKIHNPWCKDIINLQQSNNLYKKIISFVAYQKDNTSPLLGWIKNGIIDNEKAKRESFPDWIMRAYILEPISLELENLLLNNDWEIVRCSRPERLGFSMLFRFLAYDDEPLMFISRDIDSRLSPRELFLINEWMASNYSFHTIRDNRQHGIPVLGGMFGMKRGVIDGSMSDLIQKALFNNDPIPGVFGEDQNFLQKYVWPIVSKDTLEHDSFGRCFGNKHCRGFPKILGNWSKNQFIGSPFKENVHVESNCDMKCEYKIF